MTSSAYPTYRESDIAWISRIPSAWKTVPLFSVLQESKTLNRGALESNLLSLSYGRIVRRDIRGADGLLPKSFETYQIIEPDYLVFRFTDLQNDHRSLRSALARERGIITSAYSSARPVGIDARYVDYLMRSYDTSKVFYALGGGVRQTLKFDDVARLPVILPSPDEQRGIADYLDRETARIDTLIAKQEQLVATLRERRASAIDRAIESRPEGWTTSSLRHLLLGIDQGVSPQAESGLADSPGAVGVLKAGCANRGVFRQDEHKLLPAGFAFDPAIAVHLGDILVSRASGSPDLVGSAAIVDQLDYELILSDKLFRLRPREVIDPRFLTWALNSRWYREQVKNAISGAQGLANNLPVSDLRSFQIAYPRIEEQAAIAASLGEQTAKIDRLMAKTERFIELAKERRSALITAAVTGQIDIRSDAA